MWLRDVQRALGDRLAITWKYISLDQINSAHPPEWKVWDEPADHDARRLLTYKGAEAARRQGEDAFERFRWELLTVRHVERKPLIEEPTIVEAAERAGLDVERFKADLADGARAEAMQRLAEEHTEAVQKYGVFGCPTLVFPSGRAAFLKMRPAPAADQAMRIWDSFQLIVEQTPDLAEIKRPTPPAA
ncbi:MAG: DsbA family protein [Chloroflexi bacterium]|nr:DsbA family protein [Chloroflexota bacterium]